MTDRNNPIFQTSLLDRIAEGMTVVDVNGDEIGPVEFIRAGEPGAATTRGNETAAGASEFHALPTFGTGGTGMASGAAGGGIGLPTPTDQDEPEIDEPFRSRFLLNGFIKIDGSDLLDTDYYASADMIADVTNDRVRLNVPMNQLPRET